MDVIQDRIRINLSWLLRLRWWAIFGQVVIVWVAAYGLGISLPPISIGVIFGLGALTNVAGHYYLSRHQNVSKAARALGIHRRSLQRNYKTIHPMSRRASYICLLFVIVTALGERQARAAACCLSATAFGTGRLLIWEDWAVGLSTSISGTVGYWNEKGDWTPNVDDYSELEWRSSLWVMVAATEKVSFYGSLPWSTIHREAGDLTDTNTGIGDVTAGVRYEAVSIGEFAGVPGIALTLGIVGPSGTSTDHSDTTLGTDITGRGAWAATTSLSVEHTRVPWFIRGDIGAVIPFERERDDLGKRQRLGPRLDLVLASGRELSQGLVMSVVARFGWESELSIDGKQIADSDKLDTGIGAALSWQFHDHWTLQAAFDTGLFFNTMGANLPGRTTGTLGLRYGYF